jgi:hypothetical protein
MLLDVLCDFHNNLSPHLRSAAVAVLVAGNAVELTLDLMEAEVDVPNNGVAMFAIFLADPEGQKRMCEPGAVNQLIRWIARRLLKVRNIIVRWGDGDEE